MKHRKYTFSKTIAITTIAVTAVSFAYLSEYKVNPDADISKFEPRNEVWGKYYPKQFETYYETADTTFKSKHNSSAKTDALALRPNLVVLWAGYAFSRDYSQPRGHFYALEDVKNTLRTGAPNGETKSIQPNTCWSCKSPDVPRVMNEIGIAEFYKGTWDSKGTEIINTIGCSDCHNSKTMELQISRPALKEAFERQGKDIAKVSKKEMKSLVCAQCHVEYFFDKRKDKDVPYLTFPWDKGMTIEDMEKYYDEINYSDWTHALSKAPMLKAQHPDFELAQFGIHAQRGVSCATCHMAYDADKKFTNHKIQSPLANMENTCLGCHNDGNEETLRKNVYDRQDKIKEILNKLEEVITKAHIEAKFAWDAGAKEIEMKKTLHLIRQAQWRWDFAAAGHGNAFHAPLETARIISHGMEKAQEARLELLKILISYNVKTPITMPDLSTKEKAQEFIGLNMEKLKSDKAAFIKTILPQWQIEGKKRETTYDKKK